MMKKILSIFLCLVLLLASLTVCAEAAGEKNIYFLPYCRMFTVKDDSYTPFAKVEFNMDWFGENEENSSLIFNMPLCYMTSVLSSAAYSKSKLEESLNILGFSNEWYNERFSEPTYDEDGIRFCFSTKNYISGDTPCRLLLISIGGTYKEEWIGNFSVGNDTLHKSFNAAANKVIDALDDYMDRFSDDKQLKILITGHSRGGAVSNLVAKKLCDSLTYCEQKDIYAYTFSSPNVTTADDTDASKYANIFNVVNSEDFVTYCPAPQWNYWRYGNTLALPTVKTCDEQTVKDFNEQFDYFSCGNVYQNYQNGADDVTNMIKSINYSSQESYDGFVNKKYDLSAFLPDSIVKKYDLDISMTTSDLFTIIARFLADQVDLSSIAKTLILAYMNPAFHQAVEFFITGVYKYDDIVDILKGYLNDNSELYNYITFEDLKPLFEKSMGEKIRCAHASEGYISWLSLGSEISLIKLSSPQKISKTKEVYITNSTSDVINDLLTVLVPSKTSYASTSVKLSYKTDIENIRKIEWSSDNLLVRVDKNGNVSNVGFFSRKATITVAITDTNGNVYTDKILAVFYKNNMQLSRHVSNAYTKKYTLFTGEQISEIMHLVKTVALNYVKTKLV